MLMQGETVERDGRKWTEIPYTAYGDYVGTTVERANNEVLLKNFPHEKFWCSAWWLSHSERATCLHLQSHLYPVLEPRISVLRATLSGLVAAKPPLRGFAVRDVVTPWFLVSV